VSELTLSPEFVVPSTSGCPWMDHAMGEMGIAAKKGSASNKSVVKYLKSCDPRYADDGALATDETDWCSAFVNWCLAEASIPGTRHTRARSWIRWGLGFQINEPRFGAIAVLTRTKDKSLAPRGKGHVAFFWSISGDRLYLLGGNQGRKVSIKPFRKENLLCYLWPNQLCHLSKSEVGYLTPPSKLFP
jgi:uncharacterized protein (TIGR02594 family)